MNQLVSLKKYDNYIEASQTLQLLEEYGIYGYIANEYTVQSDWLLSQAIGGIELQVFKNDLEKAKSVIQLHEEQIKTTENNVKIEYTIKNSKYGDKTCPKCGSNHIYQDENLNGIFGLSILFLGFPIKVKNSKFHCYYCGNVWKDI